MLRIFLTLLFFIFSLNAHSKTLDADTKCSAANLNNNLYEIVFQPYRSGSMTGNLRLLMQFKKQKATALTYSYDMNYEEANAVSIDNTTTVKVFKTNSRQARGCYVIADIYGTSYNDANNPTRSVDFRIYGSTFISRENVNGSQNKDIDYIHIPDGVINYGGSEYIGSFTFTQIR